MMNFKNISSLANVVYSFPVRRDEISLEFLSWWWISIIFYHSATCDVLFLFINMRSFEDFYHHEEFQRYVIIDQRLMFFFSSSTWDDFRISPIMMNFNNISSLAKGRCSFSLHENGIVSEFLSRCWISTVFRHWPTSDVLFVFINIRWF